MATSLSNLLALLALDESAYLKGLDSSKRATDSFAGNLASVGGAVVLGAITLAATAVVGVGAAAFDAAETVDEAFDSIAVATGAQGDDLLQLQEDWKKVFTSIPTDAQTSADVIGVLNTRLGLMGEGLQNLTIPLLEVSRLLKGDALQYAEDFTRVIGDWNIPVENAAGSLDQLFVAGQRTGIPLDMLMQRIVQYGAPMRNFGFSFEEAAALMASFEAQGVNTEIVMSGLRIAQGKFIAQNKDMKTGLWDTVEAIQNAANGTDALAIATEIFGAKAAGDMVDTIRAGKFDLDALVESMINADGAILDAAEATSDWGETWKIFQNKMTTALAPIGEKLREGMGEALDQLTEIVSRPDVMAAFSAFADFAVVAISKVVEYIPVFITGVQDFITFLQNNDGIVIAVFAALAAAAIVWAVTSIAAAASTIAAMLPVIAVIALIGLAAYLLYEAWTNNWGGIREKTAAVWGFIKKTIAAGMEFIGKVIDAAMKVIQPLMAAREAAMQGDWYAFGQNLRNAWEAAWNLITRVVSNAWSSLRNAVGNLIQNVLSAFREIDWGEIGRNIVEGLAAGIFSNVQVAVNAILALGEAVMAALKGFFGISSPSKLMQEEIAPWLVKGAFDWRPFLNDRFLEPALMPVVADAQLDVRRGDDSPPDGGRGLVLNNYGTIRTETLNELRGRSLQRLQRLT